MPLFGAHLSVSGGFHFAAEAAVELHCDTVQIFSKAPSQWHGKPIAEGDAKLFRDAVKKAKLKFPTVHDSYLINLAAPEEAPWKKSIAAFVDEIKRADQLGAQYLVTHPGAHVGGGEEAGVKRVIEALKITFEQTADAEVMVLLETTAGMGTTLGYRFEHIADMLDGVGERKRIGVCVDTCHIFAAGYQMGSDEDYQKTFGEFDRLIGLNRLKLFHLNDSVKPLGSRVDRHAAIGQGHIGEGAFRRIVTDPRFAKLPMILETPKEGANGEAMDPVNLAKLKSFLPK
ncbi:MAG: deoxyribonuclease IV [Gemmataceae bacterium]